MRGVGDELAFTLAGLVQAECHRVEAVAESSEFGCTAVGGHPGVQGTTGDLVGGVVEVVERTQYPAGDRADDADDDRADADQQTAEQKQQTILYVVARALGRHPEYCGAEHAPVVRHRTGDDHLATTPGPQRRWLGREPPGQRARQGFLEVGLVHVHAGTRGGDHALVDVHDEDRRVVELVVAHGELTQAGDVTGLQRGLRHRGEPVRVVATGQEQGAGRAGGDVVRERDGSEDGEHDNHRDEGLQQATAQRSVRTQAVADTADGLHQFRLGRAWPGGWRRGRPWSARRPRRPIARRTARPVRAAPPGRGGRPAQLARRTPCGSG